MLLACKPTVPGEYISPDDMVDVLYDYYVSQAMADQDTKDGKMGYNRRVYFLAVLKKHGVTEAEFDSSMVYYHRRTRTGKFEVADALPLMDILKRDAVALKNRVIPVCEAARR